MLLIVCKHTDDISVVFKAAGRWIQQEIYICSKANCMCNIDVVLC